MAFRTVAPSTPDPDRRRLLQLAVAGALAAPLLPFRALAQTPADRWRTALIINALGGLDDPNLSVGPQTQAVAASNDRQVDARAIRDAHTSGLTAVNVTLGFVAGDMDPFAFTITEIGVWDRIVRQHAADLLKVETAADILRAKSDGRIGVIFGFQNTAQVGEKVERIDTFADLGVRVIQLTYNPQNQLGGGSMASGNPGLTELGRAAIDRLNRNRVMVDLSHSDEQTCLDAARASAQPISINHTGCRALTDLPRNKTDAELRLVADRGGFVGIYFMPFLAASGHAHATDVVAHLEHAVDVCGEDHVGIGTDGSVTAIDDLDRYAAELAREVAARRQAGIGAAGERADTYPFVVDLRGVSQFHDLADRLAARGHSTGRIEKILGRNFLRYAQDIWGA
jgi:membrane dipeptidase